MPVVGCGRSEVGVDDVDECVDSDALGVESFAPRCGSLTLWRKDRVSCIPEASADATRYTSAKVDAKRLVHLERAQRQSGVECPDRIRGNHRAVGKAPVPPLDDSERLLLHRECEQEHNASREREESKHDEDDPHPATGELRTDPGKEQDGGEEDCCQDVVVSGLVCLSCHCR